MKKALKLAIAAGIVSMAGIANATPTSFTLPSLPMDQIYTLGGTVLAGLAVIWGFRKIVKSVNRT